MPEKKNDGKSRAYHEGKKWFEDGFPYDYNPYIDKNGVDYKDWDLAYKEAKALAETKKHSDQKTI